MKDPMHVEDVKKIFANPFYCLKQVHPIFCEEHEPLITEEHFIAVGIKAIYEFGAEKYLRLLLANLKGEYVKSPDDSPEGYKNL